MRLKHKNGTAALFVAVLLTCSFAIALVWNTDFSEIHADVKEWVLSRDPGYSRYPGLDTLMVEMPEIIYGNMHGFPERPALETVYIDINPENYRILLEDRKEALAKNVLVDPHEVKARIRYKGSQLHADVRLKGDLKDHWLSKHRMSLRVKLKKDASLFGFNEFSIQKPDSRQHPYDSVFQSVMRASDNLASVHDYVNVIFNGKPWGVMIMEEAMTAEYLEKLGKKESLVIRFSNEEKGVVEEKAKLAGIPMYTDYRLSDDRLYLKIYEENKYAENDNFRKWYTYIAENRIHGTEAQSRLYDIDAYGKALLIASIWNDGHPLWFANSRHYFNPYTLQLQPVTTDAFVPFSIRAFNGMFPRRIFDPLQNNSVYNSVSTSVQFQDKLDSLYAEARQAILIAKDRYFYYHSYFPLDPVNDTFISVLEENIQILDISENRDLLLAPRALDVNYEGRAPDPEQLILLQDHVHIRHFDDGRVEVYNLLPATVHLDSLVIDGLVEFTLDRDIPPYDPATYEAVTIQTNFRGLLDDRLAVKTRYRDQARLTRSGMSLLTAGIYNPLLAETQPGAEEFLEYEDGQWRFKPGDWTVTRPLVLNGNVTIPPGTSLHFDAAAYLIIKGALQAAGETDAPIILDAAAASWKGIYVLNAPKQSVLSHVRVRNYTALEDGLLSLTGGVNFYRADVDMDDVELSGAMGEDAVNVVHSSFRINNLRILDAASDGLDSDFSSGLIEGSTLARINGDGLDFSGSTVEIRDLAANGIHDKAVSVGEGSTIRIIGGTITDVGAAVVSKDGSHTYASNLDIGTYVVAGAMSYQKKSFYDRASLTMENVTIAGDTPFIRQTGSTMMVNGQAIRDQDIDVDYLYENTVMKK